MKRYFNKPLFLLLSLGIFWGSGYSIARYCVTHGVSSLGYSFWQSLGPALFLCLADLFLRRKKSALLSFFHPTLWLYFLACGLIGIALPNTLMYYAAAHLPSSILAVLINTAPLMIYPLALISRQERFQVLRLVALALGCIGIILIITHIQKKWPEQHGFHWASLALITPLCFALSVCFINPFKPIALHPLTAASGMLLFSSFILLPFLLHFHAFYPLDLNLISFLILLEIVLSSLGYVIFFRLIYLAGPVYYSFVGGVIVITGIVLGKTLFHDPWSLLDTLGTVFILLAIYLISRQKKRSGEGNL